MFVQFYFKPVERGNSDDGLPFYEDQVYIKITRDATHSVERKANEDDYERFEELHKKFLKATSGHKTVEGYPLHLWSVLTPAQIQNFNARDIYTVQELADLSETKLKKMPREVSTLRDQAVLFVELAGAGEGLTKKAKALKAENTELLDQVNTLKARVTSLEGMLQKESA